MATLLQNLIIARDAVGAELAAQSAKTNKPEYSVGGRSVSWDAYRAHLISQIKELRAEIIKLQGGVEIHTIALG